MGNLREALDHLRKFLEIDIDCDSLLLLYGASNKAGVDLNQFMLKLSASPELLKNFNSILGTVLVGEVAVQPVSTIFHVDRSTPFDPVSVLGSGASFWRGPRNGRGIKGSFEQDARSMALIEIDLATIQFKSYISDSQTSITGEKRILAIKAVRDDVPLDAETGQALYEEEGQKILRWLFENRGIIWFECLGQTLRGAYGGRYSLVLYRLGDGSWRRIYYCLGGGRGASGPAAVVCKP